LPSRGGLGLSKHQCGSRFFRQERGVDPIAFRRSECAATGSWSTRACREPADCGLVTIMNSRAAHGRSDRWSDDSLPATTRQVSPLQEQHRERAEAKISFRFRGPQLFRRSGFAHAAALPVWQVVRGLGNDLHTGKPLIPHDNACRKPSNFFLRGRKARGAAMRG
jgi:hypothetical protein